MAAIGKLTVLALLVCFLCLIEAKKNKHHEEKKPAGHQGHKDHHHHHFVKRDADDYQDDGDDFKRPEYNFDRPHRIRVLPGFLH